MREIKFRAWDAKRGRMILSPHIEFYAHNEWSVECVSVEEQMAERVARGHHACTSCGFDAENGGAERAVLMQYTGLLDKNGKEIYEGDIIRYTQAPHEDTFRVEGVDVFPVEWSREADGVGWNIYPFQECEYEVIGNIYENPGLLK